MRRNNEIRKVKSDIKGKIEKIVVGDVEVKLN